MDQAGSTELDQAGWARLLRSPSLLHAGAHPSVALVKRRILITGAAGSIGSALALKAVHSAPASLLLLDSSENALYELDRTLRAAGSTEHTPLLGTINDRHLLAQVFSLHRPQIVLHAAACKHVPLMEQNPTAAILNNALGTLNLAAAASAAAAEAMVLVSTDKAVDPISIMGASKRIAELAILTLGAAARTRMSAVRLGNVAGSQGSVLPLFRDQLARGVPITVTHPEAHRYFMTTDQAVEAILGALNWPETPAVLVPELGRPRRILDLARYLVGSARSDTSVVFTGLRPGDKMTESLLACDEHWSSAPSVSHAGLRAIASPTPPPDILESTACELMAAIEAGDLRSMLQAVLLLVPAYRLGPALTHLLDPTRA